MIDSQKQLWLVKTSGQILGPLNVFEIEALLRSKELVVLDEVCLPQKRWTYIRDEKTFVRIIEELREEDFSSDIDEHTETVGVSNEEMTVSLTDALATEPGKGSEIVYDAVEEIVNEPHHKKNTGNEQVARYGTTQTVQQEINRFSKSLRLGLVFFVIVIAGFFAFRVFVSEPKQAAIQTADYVSDGFKALRIGEYALALENFENAYEVDSTRQEIYVFLGALLIQVNNETVRGKRFLHEVLDFDGPNKKYAYTGLGVANLVDSELRFAKKSFESALALDPEYKSALINLATVHFYKGNYDRAIEVASKVINLGADDKIVFFVVADSYIKKWESSKDPKNLVKAKEAVNSIKIYGYDYRQESWIYEKYINYLQGVKTSEKDLLDIIEINPHLTSEHRHDIMAFRNNISWLQISEKCFKIISSISTNIYASVLKSICEVKSGAFEKAKQSIKSAMSQNPQDILAQTVFAYVLKESGEEEASLVALGRATEMNRNKDFVLPLYLQAYFCHENKDTECERENWLEILKIHSDSLTAMVYLASLNYDEGKVLGMEREVFRAYSLSPNYIPLLKLKEKTEEQKAFGEGLGS